MVTLIVGSVLFVVFAAIFKALGKWVEKRDARGREKSSEMVDAE